MNAAYQLDLFPLSIITIRTNMLENIEVAAVWRNDLFAIHHELVVVKYEGKFFNYLSVNRWTLTHIPTGIGLCSSSNKEDLVDKAKNPTLAKLISLVKYDEAGKPLVTLFLQQEIREILSPSERASQ